jgi:hypothetical protein
MTSNLIVICDEDEKYNPQKRRKGTLDASLGEHVPLLETGRSRRLYFMVRWENP